MNPAHEAMPRINEAKIAALAHGYRVPASSSAKTKRTDAASINTTPTRSRRRNDAMVKRLQRRFQRVISLVEMSDGRRKMMRAVAAAPAGALEIMSMDLG